MIPGCLYGVPSDLDDPATSVYIETIVASERSAPWEALCCDVFLENGRVSCCVSASDFEAYELWNPQST